MTGNSSTFALDTACCADCNDGPPGSGRCGSGRRLKSTVVARSGLDPQPRKPHPLATCETGLVSMTEERRDRVPRVRATYPKCRVFRHQHVGVCLSSRRRRVDGPGREAADVLVAMAGARRVRGIARRQQRPVDHIWPNCGRYDLLLRHVRLLDQFSLHDLHGNVLRVCHPVGATGLAAWAEDHCHHGGVRERGRRLPQMGRLR